MGVRDKAFKILTEREVSEILKDTAGRTPRKVDGVAIDKSNERQHILATILEPQIGRRFL
jgi:flagellar biosynthesis chaperone FliJ